SPFDLYTQIAFLDPVITGRGTQIGGRFWASKGIHSYRGFTTQFGVFNQGILHYKDKDGNDKQRSYPQLVKYKNIDLLNSWLSEVSDRVLKEDVLGLPKKLYTSMSFDLSPEQRRVYDDLKSDAMSFLESGELVPT